MATREEQQLFAELIEKCEAIIKDCGFELPKITYKLNGRFTSTLGQCTRVSDNNYKVELALYVLRGYNADGDHKSIQSTILHEMCHTLKGGMSHGELWKRYVGKINVKYGYNIERTSRPSASCNEARGVALVELGCSRCSLTWSVTTNRKIAKNPQLYICKCGGTIFKK